MRHDLHFTGKKQIWKGQAICPGSHSWRMAEPAFKLKESGHSQSCILNHYVILFLKYRISTLVLGYLRTLSIKNYHGTIYRMSDMCLHIKYKFHLQWWDHHSLWISFVSQPTTVHKPLPLMIPTDTWHELHFVNSWDISPNAEAYSLLTLCILLLLRAGPLT